jgi:hypothetical protein
MKEINDPFLGRDEIVLVEYDEIIKSPYPLLLEQISTRYSEAYEQFIWLDEFREMDMNNLQRLCVQRTDIDLFRYLSKTEFDYVTALKELKDKYMNIYKESPLLSMGDGISKMLSQKYVKQVYIHTDVYDVRVHRDIQDTFHDMDRTPYVTGPISDVIQQLEGVTCYILKDIHHVPLLFEKNKFEYSEILVGAFGFNYNMDAENTLTLKIDMEKLKEKGSFKFGTFQPVTLKEDAFTHIVEG